MIRSLTLMALWAGVGILAPSAALACSVIIDPRQPPAVHRRETAGAIARASAVIDGEVVRPGSYGQPPALVYAHRVLKGPDQRWFQVGTNNNDSCAVELPLAGARMRMILSGGPSEYVLYRDQSDARMEDVILGSDRRRDYPYFPGARSAATDAE